MGHSRINERIVAREHLRLIELALSLEVFMGAECGFTVAHEFVDAAFLATVEMLDTLSVAQGFRNFGHRHQLAAFSVALLFSDQIRPQWTRRIAGQRWNQRISAWRLRG